VTWSQDERESAEVVRQRRDFAAVARRGHVDEQASQSVVGTAVANRHELGNRDERRGPADGPETIAARIARVLRTIRILP
jgi:hypothetical protein